MTFLELNHPSKTPHYHHHHQKLHIKEESKSGKTAQNILSSSQSVRPKIERIESSSLLSRAAEFLPKLAASNRAILQKSPEDLNIERLTGSESRIIEMKLGLGVFESIKNEGDKEDLTDDKDDDNDNDDEDDNDDNSSSSYDNINDNFSKRKILVLPSELKAAAQEAKAQNDPFEKIIQSILFFDSDSDEGENVIMSNSENVLEFQ